MSSRVTCVTYRFIVWARKAIQILAVLLDRQWTQGMPPLIQILIEVRLQGEGAGYGGMLHIVSEPLSLQREQRLLRGLRIDRTQRIGGSERSLNLPASRLDPLQEE